MWRVHRLSSTVFIRAENETNISARARAYYSLFYPWTLVLTERKIRRWAQGRGAQGFVKTDINQQYSTLRRNAREHYYTSARDVPKKGNDAIVVRGTKIYCNVCLIRRGMLYFYYYYYYYYCCCYYYILPVGNVRMFLLYNTDCFRFWIIRSWNENMSSEHSHLCIRINRTRMRNIKCVFIYWKNRRYRKQRRFTAVAATDPRGLWSTKAD
jgi:hypothetical protein